MSCGSLLALAASRPPTIEIGPRRFADPNQSNWFAWIGSCLDRGSQRRALSELDDHLLKDIGITRLQALKEAGKPAWRV